METAAAVETVNATPEPTTPEPAASDTETLASVVEKHAKPEEAAPAAEGDQPKAEAAAEPKAEEKPPEPPKPPERIAKALAVIAQRERRAQRMEAEAKALQDKLRPLIEAAALFEQDPRAALEKLGKDPRRIYEGMTNKFLDKKPTPEEEVASLRAEIQASNRAREAAEQKAQLDRIWSDAKAEALREAAARDAVYLQTEFDDPEVMADEIVQYRALYEQKYGVNLTTTDAIGKMELALQQRAQKREMALKLRAGVVTAPQGAPKREAAAKANPPRTLPNNLTNSPPAREPV